MFNALSSNTRDEEVRRHNISKFLEGLLDEEETVPSKMEHENLVPSPSTSLKTDTKSLPKPRSLAEMIKIPKKCLEKPVKLRKPMSPLIPHCCFRCPPELRLLGNLPVSELRAFTPYPGLLRMEKGNISKIPFSIHNIKHSNTLVHIYTGITLANGFFKLASMFRKEDIIYYKGWVVGQLTIKQQILLTLMKLRLGMTDVHLSVRFQCSLETVTNTVNTWLLVMHDNLFDSMVGLFSRLRDPRGMDGIFRFLMFNSVTVYSEVPRNPHIPHKPPLEPYKTVLAFTADGIVTFAGELYAWTGTTEAIIQDCGILHTLMDGDVIFHDRSVRLSGILPDGVFSRPVGFDDPKRFLEIRNDLYGRLLEYQILKCIPTSLWDHANTIWQVVVILANYSQFEPLMTDFP